MDSHYIGKTVRVFETNTRYYDGIIHDVFEDDNEDTVFFVVDDEYGFLNKARKEQIKEIVITKTLKDLE